MERIRVRLTILLLIGIVVTALALYAPDAGSAVVGAATVVTLLAQLTTRE